MVHRFEMLLSGTTGDALTAARVAVGGFTVAGTGQLSLQSTDEGLLLAIDDAAAYHVDPGRTADDASNRQVEADLDSLLDLVQRVIGAVRPQRGAVFADGGRRWLVNQRLLWTADRALLADDIRAFARAWRETPPARDDAMALPRGARELREQAWDALDVACAAGDGVVAAHIDEVVAAGKVDVVPIGNGLLVLDWPWWLDGYVDRFVLAVLRAAGSPRERFADRLHAAPPAAVDGVRKFLASYAADADSLAEIRRDVRRMVQVNRRGLDAGRAALASLLSGTPPPGLLTELVARDANRSLDDPSDTGARQWLREVLAILDEELG